MSKSYSTSANRHIRSGILLISIGIANMGCTHEVTTDEGEATGETPSSLLGNLTLGPGAFLNGQWKVDSNGNGVREVSDATFAFGTAGDIPLVGYWNGGYGNQGACNRGDTQQVAVYRPTNRTFYLDIDGSRTWNPPTDIMLQNLAPAVTGFNDYPVVWKAAKGTGANSCLTVIGYFRTPNTGNDPGRWMIDWNGSGVFGDNLGGFPDTDFLFGKRGDIPAPIRGTLFESTSVAAVFRNGQWFIDVTNQQQWDGCGLDSCTLFGVSTSFAFGNAWRRNINTFDGTTHYIDGNSTPNFMWDSPPDLQLTYAQSFEAPVFGIW